MNILFDLVEFIFGAIMLMALLTGVLIVALLLLKLFMYIAVGFIWILIHAWNLILGDVR